MPKNMLLLITIDGLDWQMLQAAIRSGAAPAMAHMIRSGRQVRLTSPFPAQSCAVWASIATGTLPEAHGLTFPQEAWAGGLRPSGAASWRVPPIWEMLERQGIRTGSLCFPHTRPATAGRGTHIDDRVLQISGIAWDDWPLPLDAAPSSLREEIREVRVHSSDVAREMLLPFRAEHPCQKAALAVAIARSSTWFALARTLLTRVELDFAAFHLDWPRAFAEALSLKANAPLPTAIWALLDNAIAQIQHMVSGAALLICSPGTAGRAGFLLAAGNESLEFAPIHEASILDLAPTIAARFGRSIPSSPGKSLLRTGSDLVPIDIPAISPVFGKSAADISRVEQVGLPLPFPPQWWPAPKLLAEAELLLDRDIDASEERVGEALELAPSSQLALGLAGLIAFSRGDSAALEGFAHRLQAVAPESLWRTMLQAGVHVLRKEPTKAAPLLQRVEAEGWPDDLMRVAGAWLMLGKTDAAARCFERVLESQPDRVQALLGLASTKSGRPVDAEQLLRRVLAIDPGHREARQALVETLIFMGRREEASTLGVERA